MKRRKGLAFILALSLVLSSFSVAFATDVAEETTPVTETTTEAVAPVATATNTAFADIAGHWAKAYIAEMVGEGIISGYPDGSFKPDGKITRAEFAALIVKGFSLTGSSGKVFNDTKDHWAKDFIAIANAKNIVNGYSETSFGPDDPITREQMAVMVVKAAKLIDKGSKTFADSSSISEWAEEAVAIATGSGIITGYPDNTFKPQGNTSRAEAAVVLGKSLITSAPPVVEPKKPDYSVISKAGTYGPKTGTETATGNVTVKAEDTILQNLIIKGDLTIAKEVGDGDVTLDNIKVLGKTFIRGGGKDSIHINGGDYNDIIIESTASGAVRIVATNTDGLQVVISANAKGEEIILNGEFKNVTVNAEDVKVITQADTTINELKVPSGLKDINIELAKDSSVKEIVLNSEANVRGQGTIKEASGSKAKDSRYSGSTQPDTITTPAPSGGGGGGSSSSSGSKTVVSAININKSTTTLVEGTTETLTVTFTPSNASNKTITWTTSDASKATIDSTGKVRAVSAGTATITAKSNNGKTATCVVTVTTTVVPVSAIKVNKTTTTLTVGATETITATVQPTNASNKNVTWSSSKDAIATVDANGKVTAVAEGTATITVTSVADSSKKATVGVTVKAETLVSDFEFDASTKTIIKYKGTEKSVAIPAKIGGVDVEVIGEEAFSNKYLTSVVIPNSVTSIEKHAFIANKLTSVVIPDSVTSINQGAFSNNELTSINIPNSVTTIEKEVFQYNKLTSIVIPDSVTTIGQWAFLENELTSIEIPNSVATIGASAFLENKLTSLAIPNSVKTIGEAAFNNNQLPDSQAFIYARNADGSEDKSKIVSYGGAKRENVVIPNIVITIGEAAFMESELLSITIPNSVTTIEEYGFGANKLTEVTIPISVTTLGDGAFEDNGPSSTSGNIPTSDFVGTWEIVGDATEWTKKGASPDTTPPVITLNGDATVNVAYGAAYEDAGATANDDVDGDITSSIITTISNDIDAETSFDNTKAATYTYHYNVKDAAGNHAIEVTRTVIVAEQEKVATPVITTSKTNATNREAGVKFSVGDVSGVTFYYTLDGTEPTTASEQYTGAVTLTAPDNDAVATINIKVIGIKADAIDSDVATATVTYAAKGATTYTVTVSNDGNGTGTANPVTATSGTEITLSATANSGYQFKEWQVVSGGVTISSDKFTMPAGNVEVKAIFEALPPVISGVTISPKTTSVQKGTSATFSAVVTGTGAFDSTVTWSVSGGISGTNIDNNGKLTVDASETATTITVTATANGDSSKSDSATVTITDAPITKYAVTVTSGTGSGEYAKDATVIITANDPATGKVFDKWTSLDVTFANASNASTTFTMPNKTVTVTATYKNIDYSINYELDGGTNNASNPVTYTIETDTITLTDATRADYIFEGWYKEAGFTNKVTQIAKGSTGDMTLYAKWAEITQLTIGDPTITTSKQYDGNTTTTTVTAGSLNGVAAGDTVIVSAVANYDNKNIGTEKTITVVYTLTGKDAGKYIKPIDYTTTGEITAAQLSIGNPELTKTKVYDGNTKAVVTAGTLNGVVGSEVVNVDASANYDSADVGTNKTITVIYTISGTDAGNYIAPENDTVTDGEITTSTKSDAEIAKEELEKLSFTPEIVVTFNTDTLTTVSDAQGVVKAYLETLITNATVEVVWTSPPGTISNDEENKDYNFGVTITGKDGSGPTINIVTVNVQIKIGYFKFNTGTGTITGIAYTEYQDAKGFNLVIPESINGVDVEAIKENVFAGMNFTSVEIPNKVKVIGEGAFKNNKFITVIIPDSVTSIGSFAFLNNELTEVTIPDSVTTIGESAFKDNKLTKVTIPTSVTYLGANEFLENGPEKNTTNTPTEPGTWNVVETVWVKENNAPTVVADQEAQTGTATPKSNDDKTAAVDYTEDLSTWFEDVDTGDTLTYLVVSATDANSVNVIENVTISGNDITYTPAAAQADKTVTIVVKANDGTVDSTGNVTITVTVGSVPADAPSIDPDHLSFSAATNKFTVAAEAPTGTYKIFFNDSDTADTTTVSHITGTESVSGEVATAVEAGQKIHYTFTETDKEESVKTADGAVVATLGAPSIVLGHDFKENTNNGYTYRNYMHSQVDRLDGDNTVENIIQSGIITAYRDADCTIILGTETITSNAFNNLNIGTISGDFDEITIYITQTDVNGNESGVTNITYRNGN